MRVFAFPEFSEAPFDGDVFSVTREASDEEVCWGRGERVAEVQLQPQEPEDGSEDAEAYDARPEV